MNKPQPKKIYIPRKILYIILLIIFSSSSVGLVENLESLFMIELLTLMLILLSGWALIYLSFHHQHNRIR